MGDMNDYIITRLIHGKIEAISVKAHTRREAIIMADDYAAEARKRPA